MAEKTWFITGTSRGFGREWAAAALERGDRVAATARDPETLADRNTLVSADYVGYTVDALRRRHGCPVVYVTGTVGGLCFAAWAGADRLWIAARRALRHRARAR